MTFKNFHFDLDDNGVASVLIDRHDESMNTLGKELVLELSEVIVLFTCTGRRGCRRRAQGRFGLDRELDGDVQRRCTAHFIVDELHAAVDLRRFPEVVDETVLDLQPADAHDRQRDA